MPPLTDPLTTSFQDAIGASLDKLDLSEMEPGDDTTQPVVTDPVVESPVVPDPVAAAIAKTPDVPPTKGLFDDLLATTQSVKPVDKTTTDPVVEEVVEDDPKLPDNAPEAQKVAFTKISDKLKETRELVKTTQAEIETLRKQGPSTELTALQAELAKAKAERDQLSADYAEASKVLSVSKLEATREYKTVIEKPLADLTAKLGELVSGYEVTVDQVKTVLFETDPVKRRAAFKELTSEFDAADAFELRQLTTQYIELEDRKKVLIENAQVALQDMEKKQTEFEQQQREKYQAETRKAYDEVWPQFQQAIPLLNHVEGNDEWNAQVDAVRERAYQIDQQPLDHRDRAALTMQAAALPMLYSAMTKYAQAIMSQKNAAEAELAIYKKGTPGAGPSGSDPLAPVVADPKLGFLDAFESGLKRSGV